MGHGLKKMWFLLMAVTLVPGLILGACAAPKTTSPAATLPDTIAIATWDVGSGTYVAGAALGEAILKKHGVKVRAIPAGDDMARYSTIRQHIADFVISGSGGWFAFEGIEDFAAIDWGPQPVRLVFDGPTTGLTLITAGDTGIKTPADFKGKRVAWVVGAPAINVPEEACLAFANLTWNDVKKVEFPSLAAAYQGLIEGKVDGVISLPNAPKAYELEASPRKLYYVEFPLEDTAGWARLRAVAPYMRPLKATLGAGLSEGAPKIIPAHSNPLQTYIDTDPNLVYFMAKALHELQPEYAKAYEGAKLWTLENSVSVKGMPVPFHEGAIKYYKEIKHWSAELEQYNQNLLAREQKLKKARERAVAEAAEKQVKAADFKAFWLKIRDTDVPFEIK